MKIPHEPSRAIVQAQEFLKEFSWDASQSEEVRRTAMHLLRDCMPPPVFRSCGILKYAVQRTRSIRHGRFTLSAEERIVRLPSLTQAAGRLEPYEE